MAAIGARPLIPPGVPRGETRRPSGPREPKSPLTSVSIDRSSPDPDSLRTREEVSPEESSKEAHQALDAAPLSTSHGTLQADNSRVETDEPITPKPIIDASDMNRTPSLNTNSSVDDPAPVNEVCDNLGEEEEEDEEVARRRRLAERMAKMGARPMMGGMMPMIPNSGSTPGITRRPTNAGSSGSQPSHGASPAMALGGPPPVPSSRPLPPPPSEPMRNTSSSPRRDGPGPPPAHKPPSSGFEQTSDQISRDVISSSPPMPSSPTPPRRSVPVRPPAHRGTGSGSEQMIDQSHRNSISSSPPMPSSPPQPPMSPGGRPKVPSGYKNVPKRSSTLSQPGHMWGAQVDEPLAMQEEEEKDEVHYDESTDDQIGAPPPIPLQRPRPVSAMPTSGSITRTLPNKRSSDPIRRSSLESSRSSNNPQDTTEKDLLPRGMPSMLNTYDTKKGDRKASHGSLKSVYKARDLDLASERWWRTKPVSIPRSVQSMTDVLVRLQGSSTLQKGIPTYHYELVIIRDDYSKTVVKIYFEEGNDETATEMSQIHYPPPPPYPISYLQELSASIGPQLVARAKAKEDEKGVKFVGSEENGKSFVSMIVKSVGIALEPVGETYGQVIYKCEIQDFKGAHPEIDVKDDIRPGDIIASYGATFKGKGIGHGSMSLGTVTNAHVAIVAEHDIKKNKFKAYGVWHGKVELMSYRIDELKSGSIKVFRVLDKKILEN